MPQEQKVEDKKITLLLTDPQSQVFGDEEERVIGWGWFGRSKVVKQKGAVVLKRLARNEIRRSYPISSYQFYPGLLAIIVPKTRVP